MLFGVEATLEVDPNADVSDVEITIAHDQLSHGLNDVHYGTVAVGRRPDAAQLDGRRARPAPDRGGGGADYSIAQSEIAGFALAIHSAPRQPERLTELDVRVLRPGRLHLVRALYRFPGSCRGARLVIGEDKLLTAGGFYSRTADYAALMRDAIAANPTRRAALDYSVSYDYGAEINTFAKCYAVAAAEPVIGPAA